MHGGDRDLLRRILHHEDADAKEELVRRHQRSVVRLVASVLGPTRRDLVDDASQEAFLRAFRRLASFRFDSAFSTWLHRVAYTTAIDFLRRSPRGEPWDGDPPPIEDAAIGPLERVLRRESQASVSAALARLPPPHRACLLLFYWYESPVASIAEVLDLPEGTVKSYLSRGRARLARLLDPTGEPR